MPEIVTGPSDNVSRIGKEIPERDFNRRAGF